MLFVTNDDDEYINNVKTSFIVKSFVVEKSSSIFLQIKNKWSRCYLYEKNKRKMFLNWWKKYSMNFDAFKSRKEKEKTFVLKWR